MRNEIGNFQAQVATLVTMLTYQHQSNRRLGRTATTQSHRGSWTSSYWADQHQLWESRWVSGSAWSMESVDHSQFKLSGSAVSMEPVDQCQCEVIGDQQCQWNQWISVNVKLLEISSVNEISVNVKSVDWQDQWIIGALCVSGVRVNWCPCGLIVSMELLKMKLIEILWTHVHTEWQVVCLLFRGYWWVPQRNLEKMVLLKSFSPHPIHFTHTHTHTHSLTYKIGCRCKHIGHKEDDTNRPSKLRAKSSADHD